MIRITLLHLVLLLAPLALFFLWRLVVRRPGRGRAPVEVLLLLGAVLTIASLVTTVLMRTDTEAYPSDRMWVAPRMVDGEIRPGRFVTREEYEALKAEDEALEAGESTAEASTGEAPADPQPVESQDAAADESAGDDAAGEPDNESEAPAG